MAADSATGVKTASKSKPAAEGDVAMANAGNQKMNHEKSDRATDDENDTKVNEDNEGTDEDTKTDAKRKPTNSDDVEMVNADARAPDGGAAEATPANKSKSHRKSTGGSAVKALSRKGSRRSLVNTNLDAQPGDHYLVKLKGYPPWPVIICDESMLPQTLLKTRPVTAARPDGTFTEAYADGGKRVNDRNFPVMYLHTNEFGWVINTSLQPLTAEKATESIKDKMRADLKLAFELAAKHNDLQYYKDELENFQRQQIEWEKEKATPKMAKGKSKAPDGDLPTEDGEDEEERPKALKATKRKADSDTATPERADYAKKPKIIKINTSAFKTSNGVSTPKSAKLDPPKDGKSKSKKPAKDINGPSTPRNHDSELSIEKRTREILYLRHRLQRGLLTKDSQPQESEMSSMSDYLAKLELYPELDAPIIRETKINKVLKAMIKLDDIPKEEEFRFKARSIALLESWNKVLASNPVPDSNGVNGALGGGDRDKNRNEGKPVNGSDKHNSSAKGKKVSRPDAGNKSAEPAEKKA